MSNILVVDDEAMFRELTTHALEHYGYKAFSAANCKDAWEILKSQEIDLMLLDISLPGMGGMDFVRILRRNPKFHQLPIIMLTEMEQKSYVLQAAELKVQEYLLKSHCMLGEMLTRIQRHLPVHQPVAAATAQST